jgi:hypothetical protein
MAVPSITEELAAAPIAHFIRDLGLGVADANKALQELPGSANLVYAINRAEIEVKVAISMEKGNETSAAGGLKLSVFSLNASYKNTFAYHEEASSSIRISLEAKPRSAAPPALPAPPAPQG